MSKQFDVIVIGIGGMGAATCWHLARRGVRVLGLEQHEIGHDLGSSGGVSRIVRCGYYEDPDYVPLAVRAFEYWEELAASTTDSLWKKCGGLFLGPSSGQVVAATAHSLAKHDLAYAMLEHSDLRRQFPQFRLPSDYAGVFEEKAGAILAGRAVEVMVHEALKHGGEIIGGQRVTELSQAGSSICVQTNHDAYFTDRVVVTAGPWTKTLVTKMAPHLTVTRQSVFWFWPKKPELFTDEVFPIWICEEPSGDQWYGTPCLPGRPGIKVAPHVPGKATHPDQVDRTLDEAELSAAKHILKNRIPDGSGSFLSYKTCLYSSSPDENFIIDWDDQIPGVCFACGFSGHGFKFAPVIGEALADLAQFGQTKQPIGFLAANRLVSD